MMCGTNAKAENGEVPMMTTLIEKAITAGELPAQLRGDIEASARVLVSVRRLTENGFTEEFEERVLQAEKEAEKRPFRPAAEVIAELRAIAESDES